MPRPAFSIAACGSVFRSLDVRSRDLGLHLTTSTTRPKTCSSSLRVETRPLYRACRERGSSGSRGTLHATTRSLRLAVLDELRLPRCGRPRARKWQRWTTSKSRGWPTGSSPICRGPRSIFCFVSHGMERPFAMPQRSWASLRTLHIPGFEYFDRNLRTGWHHSNRRSISIGPVAKKIDDCWYEDRLATIKCGSLSQYLEEVYMN